MKKIIIFGLCVVMVFVMASCSMPKWFDNEDTTGSSEESTVQREHVETKTDASTETEMKSV